MTSVSGDTYSALIGSSATSVIDKLDLSFDGEDRKWKAIVDRNPVANGAFVYAVKTTKVFCRPTCPSRHPRRVNVLFFPTPGDAKDAGFRPCLRCKPNSDESSLSSTRAGLIAKACKTIAEDQSVSLDELAKRSKLSKFHFHRLFKSTAGVTPQQYKMAQRDSRKDHSAEKVLFALGPCYLGHILVAVSRRGICAIDLDDDPDVLIERLQKRFPSAEFDANSPDFNQLVSVLGGAAESCRMAEWELPLDIQGTAFQHRVWNALREIPWGESRTYSDIAKVIGSPAAVRAVAKACASNQFAIAIPCHRVLRIDGNSSGYRWGIARKEALAELERKPSQQQDKFAEFRAWLEECMLKFD